MPAFSSNMDFVFCGGIKKSFSPDVFYATCFFEKFICRCKMAKRSIDKTRSSEMNIAPDINNHRFF